MDADQWWSWVLGAIGIVGFILAGKKIWWAWYVNIFNQFIWTAYSFATQQWGFLVVTGFYFVVFSRNAYLWTKEHREKYQSYSSKYDQKTIDAFDDHRRILEGEFEDYQTDTAFHQSTLHMDRRDLLQRLWHAEGYRSRSVGTDE